ncbi:MAG: DNA topoisomerase IB [Rhodoferax sp.]|nr:DNA topoisomerase IB [Rhodoferax sp.]
MTVTSKRLRTETLPAATPKAPAKSVHRTSITAVPNLAGVPAMPAGLRHTSDDTPGIRRRPRGKGFSYRNDNGQAVSSLAERERLANLAIPPAYCDVWICPSPQGHLQATGRDARGRKQYLYHADWRTARDETKFNRMVAFGSALPRLRAKVTRDLAQTASATVSRPAVMASLVRLLDTTMVRVGNDEYARTNKSYGLTTLRKRHAALTGEKLRLKFRGKSGVEHEVALKDKRVARIVQRCQALPGQELFKYLDDAGQLHSVGSAEVNGYVRAASGGDFTAKDFRTWHASATALALFMQMEEAAQEAITVTVANQLIAEVAQLLGNTSAVCRKSYIHPEVLALLLKTKTISVAAKAAQPKRKAGLSTSDCAFLAFLCALG